jgi:hypothetical protein
MRIDEVIVNDVNEAPVGMMKRATNFVQSKIGTAGSRARGAGKREAATSANEISLTLQKELGRVDPVFYQKPQENKTGYIQTVGKLLAKKFDPSIITAAELEKLEQKLEPATSPKAVRAATDQFILDLVSKSYQDGKAIGGVTTPQPNQAGGPDASGDQSIGNAVGTSAVQSLQKLDPEAQKFVINWAKQQNV